MLIELWRTEADLGYSRTVCAVCGNDFGLRSVYPMIASDRGTDLGEMCTTCLDYLNRRKNDPEDWHVRQNWPACDWPTVEDLEEARRRYPEPTPENDDNIIVWRMEREELETTE